MSRDVGGMRNYIEIKSPVRTSDGALGYERSNATVCKCWAKISPVGGSELYRYAHLEQQVSHKVTIRYNGDVAQGQHFTWDNRTFYIESVVDLTEYKEFQELACREGGNL